MEPATFSDIEFVGIAADRHITIGACHGKRRGSSDGSSSISLPSVGSKVKSHDHSLTASAFAIQEVSAIVPLSPSGLVVNAAPEPETNVPCSYWDNTRSPIGDSYPTTGPPQVPEAALPLDRYCQTPQRHERVAVSVALGYARDVAAYDDVPVFKRSSAPSPSTPREIEANIAHAQGGNVDETVTPNPLVSADEEDYQSLMRNEGLERWFESILEDISGHCAAEKQSIPQPPPPNSSPQHITSAFTQGKDDVKPRAKAVAILSMPSIMIEAEQPTQVSEIMDTDESIQAFTRDFKLLHGRRAAERNRTYRPLARRQGKRKNEEDHQQSRPGRPSSGQQSSH